MVRLMGGLEVVLVEIHSKNVLERELTIIHMNGRGANGRRSVKMGLHFLMENVLI